MRCCLRLDFRVLLELKPEKIVPHKDAWTKFLSNEEGAGKRTMFECEFEDRILQTEPETLPERLSRTEKNSDIEFSVAYPGTSTPVINKGIQLRL